MSYKNTAIILAGGIGKRMQSSLPKQFIKIGEKPIIIYTIEQFEKNDLIDSIVITVNKDYRDFLLELLKEYDFKKIKAIVDGGLTRQESIYKGLKALTSDYVIIHDSVRPFITQNLINEMLKQVFEYKAVSAGVNVKTSIIEADKEEGFIINVTDKKRLYQAQSQAFEYNLILKAHEDAQNMGIFDAHDDNMLLMQVNEGIKIKIVTGDYNLFKITTPEDIIMAQDALKRLSI